MIRVAITGGIGTGKTTISKLFKEIGIPVFNSDICARDAEKLPHIQEAFKAILGDDIYVNGEVDREKMRGIIFTNKDLLSQINNVVVPQVKEEFNLFVEENSSKPYVILESAILYEVNAHTNFDFVITVSAETNVRIKRVLKRDNISVEDVQNKMNNQLSQNEKIKRADFVIVNDGEDLLDSLEVLNKQVNCVHKAILSEILIDRLNELNHHIKKTHNTYF